MAETPKELKKENIFHDYCWTWKLKVNIDKNKIVCFINGSQNLQFTNSNREFEIVKEFNYLGILLKGQLKHRLKMGPKQCRKF